MGKFFAGFLTACILLTILCMFKPDLLVREIFIEIEPPEGQENVTISMIGEISGTANIPRLVEPRLVEPKPVEPKPVEPKPVEPKPVEPKPVPVSVTVPVSGNVETVITDARTGDELDREFRPLTGETTVTVTDDVVTTTTVFSDELRLAIDLPAQDAPENHIGAFVAPIGGLGVYYRRDWDLPVGLVGWVGVAAWRAGGTIAAGVEFSF